MPDQPHVLVVDDDSHIAAALRRADSGEGTGLGLAIAAWIVRERRGEIEIGTSAPGGASFRVQIPLRAT